MPKPKRKPRPPTIQPPHPSDKFTLEEVMEAWRRVEERAALERAAADSHAADGSDHNRASVRTGMPYPTPDGEVSG